MSIEHVIVCTMLGNLAQECVPQAMTGGSAHCDAGVLPGCTWVLPNRFSTVHEQLLETC